MAHEHQSVRWKSGVYTSIHPFFPAWILSVFVQQHLAVWHTEMIVGPGKCVIYLKTLACYSYGDTIMKALSGRKGSFRFRGLISSGVTLIWNAVNIKMISFTSAAAAAGRGGVSSSHSCRPFSWALFFHNIDSLMCSWWNTLCWSAFLPTADKVQPVISTWPRLHTLGFFPQPLTDAGG